MLRLFNPIQLMLVSLIFMTIDSSLEDYVGEPAEYPAFAFNPWTTGNLVPGSVSSQPTCYTTSYGSDRTLIMVGSAYSPSTADGSSSSSSMWPNTDPMNLGVIQAVDARNGQTVWTTSLPSPPVWTSLAQSPIGNQEKLYVATNESFMVILSSTGLELWNFTFPAGYGLPGTTDYADRTLPVWLDDRRLFLFLENPSSHMSRLYVINLNFLEVTLVWDSVTRHANSSCRPIGPTGSWIGVQGRISVVQRLSSTNGLTFLVLNYNPTNASEFALDQIYWYPDINSTLVSRTSPVAMNSTFFFGGRNSTTGEAALIAYWSDSFSTRISPAGVNYPFALEITEVVPFTVNNGERRLALVASLPSSAPAQVAVWTVLGNGSVASEVRTRVCAGKCNLLASDNSALYLHDEELNLMKYSLDDSNWKWETPTIFHYLTFSRIKAVILHEGNLFFHSPLPLALTVEAETSSVLVQVDSETGAFLGVLPTPLTYMQNFYTDDADGFLGLVFDPVSFNGSVVGIAQGYDISSQTYLMSMLPPRPDASSSSGFDKVIALEHALATPHYHNKESHVVYYTSVGIVFAFDIKNGSLLWSFAVPGSDTSGFASGNQPAPFEMEGRLYLSWQAGPTTVQILVLALDPGALNVPPILEVWNATIPTRGICVGSQPSQMIVDPFEDSVSGSKWIYFTGTGPASYCVWRFRLNGAHPRSLMWEMVEAASNTTVLPPVFGKDHIWFNDVSGTIYRQSKRNLSSTDPTDRLVLPMTIPYIQNVSPLSMEGELLFFAGNRSLVVYNASNAQLWSTTQLSLGTIPEQNAQAPLITHGAVFVGCASGVIESFNLSTVSTANTSLPLRFSRSSSVGLPLLVSSWGLLISAVSEGVILLDWSGTNERRVQRTPTGSPLKSCSLADTFYGPFIFVLCNGQLHVLDTIRGEVVLSGPAFPASFPTSFVVDLDHSDTSVREQDIPHAATTSLPLPTVLVQFGTLVVVGNVSQSLLPPAMPTPPPLSPASIPTPAPLPPSTFPSSAPDGRTGEWIGIGIGCGACLVLIIIVVGVVIRRHGARKPQDSEPGESKALMP